MHSADDNAAVDGLLYCFELSKDRARPPLKCRSGYVRVKADEPAKRYGGEYSFTMSDGTRREGAFIAEYCPKGEARHPN